MILRVVRFLPLLNEGLYRQGRLEVHQHKVLSFELIDSRARTEQARLQMKGLGPHSSFCLLLRKTNTSPRSRVWGSRFRV